MNPPRFVITLDAETMNMDQFAQVTVTGVLGIADADTHPMVTLTLPKEMNSIRLSMDDLVLLGKAIGEMR